MNKSPLNIFTWMLLAYSFVTLIVNMRIDVLLYAVAVAIFMGLAYAVSKYLLKIPTSWQNIVISACILFLVVDPLTGVEGYGILALIVLMFLLVKRLRYKGMPIVNPIVGGMLLASLILLAFSRNFFDSWWGTAYLGSWNLLWLLPVVVAGVKYFRKYYIAISFFLAYTILFWITGKMSPVFLVTTGTLYFAAGIMMSEPKTSPAPTNEQIAFGIIGGLVTFLCALWIENLALLWGIAITNLLFVGWKIIRQKMQAATPAAAIPPITPITPQN